MECKLCLQSNEDSFELQSEEGMKRQALDLLQYHFPFCFTDNSQGGRLCRQCWNNVDQFHTFYLQIQDIHVHMTSVKSETESIDESGPVTVKVEPLAATDESTADYDSDTDMKWTAVWLDESSAQHEETAFDTHSEEEANSIQGKRAEREVSTASEGLEESNVSIELQSDEPPNDSDSDWIPEEPLVPKCPICGKEFSRNSTLKMHIATHVGMDKSVLNRFKCDICGNTFRSRTKLKEHSYIHSGITDAYKCDFCDKPFRFQSSLCLHRKKQHPKEEEIRRASAIKKTR